MRKINGQSIAGAEKELHVVLGAVASITIADADQRIDGCAAEPLLNIDNIGDLTGEGGAAHFHDLAELNEAAVVIAVFIVLDQKIPAIRLLVIAQIADVGADD